MPVNLPRTVNRFFYSAGQPLARHRECPMCKQPLQNARSICLSCFQRLAPVNGPICRCSLPCKPQHDGQCCNRCATQPPHFRHARCGWLYTFPLDHVINKYKHKGDLSLEPMLLDIWLNQLNAFPFEQPDALVPIPVHWRRFWKRGFNQADRLAQGLSRQLHIPVWSGLGQTRATPKQQHLKRAARRQQQERFQITANPAGLHLVLIDDVMTTGSTVNDAAKLLLSAGALRVDVWALCRVYPRETESR